MSKRPLSLTNRLLVTFVGTLALVLGGFSATIYTLAHVYLYRQAEHRLSALLDTLAAAVEVSPDGVEWEPNTRPIGTGDGATWLVTDGQGRVIDRPKDGAANGLVEEAAATLSHERSAAQLPAPDGPWTVGQRRVLPAPTPPSGPAPAEAKPGEVKYPELILTAGVPLGPVRATLRTVGLALVVVSLLIWTTALAAGRWVCRRALAPVVRVAAAAETMGVADLAERLPRPGTEDELDGLVRSFNGLLDRLQESFDRQRRFTGDASHQLRTPLTAILGQIEVALRRPRPAEEYERVLAGVQRQARHLHQIVEALLFLSRADAETRLPGLEPVDLAGWVAAHLESWREHPRAGDLHVVNKAGTPVPVLAHPVLLAELLDNLLDNAAKYSPPGSPITVVVRGDGSEVVLAVEDRGPGLSPEELAHVFDPFFRTPDARRRGVAGVGLGLAITARLANAMGARVEAESTLGQGSCFAVRFEAPRRTAGAGQISE